MDRSTRYLTGEEIHIGDRILHAGEPAEIVLVIGRDEFEGEFAIQKDWYKQKYGRGFMVKGGPGGLVLCNEADEDIQFVARRGDQNTD